MPISDQYTDLTALRVAGAIQASGALTITGAMLPVVNASADGAVTIQNSMVFITKGTAAALTLADPAAGNDGVMIWFVATTAAAHSISNAAGSGFNAGGAGTDVCTFSAAIGNNLVVVAYGGKWLVVNNVGGTLA